MKEIIEYLLKIEKTAGDIYKDASIFFQHDKEFARFLSLLSEDEADHFDAIVSAEEYFVGNADKVRAFISLNSTTKQKIERPFIEAKEKLLSGDLTKDAMISCIVEVEFSEWNHIFLYFVNTLRGGSWEFQRLAALIQRHKERIEGYLESLPDGNKHLEKVRQLPGVWQQRILIIEDDAAIAELLSVILAREGIIETAQDAEEGLRKTSKQYFDIIISDFDMPVESRMELYEQAAKRDSSIRERFLLFTGHLTSENLAFFGKYNLRYMTKPAELNEIRIAVHEIMHGTSGRD